MPLPPIGRAGRAFAQWLLLGALVGVAAGLASALFLFLLERATQVRLQHEALVWALPLGGLVLGLLQERFGRPVRGGNNLVIDTVHEDSAQLPLRMAPIALVGTVLTHLFGGSAGREGTAVQMGASLADAIAHRFRVSVPTRRELLAAGIAGGFGSVFGTPIAGVVFGLEVVSVGQVSYHALLPALVAAVVGDLVTRGVGIVHTAYPTPAPLPLAPLLLAKWLVFGVAVAAVTVAFVGLTHGLKRLAERHVPRQPLRMALGGAVLVLLWRGVGTGDYLGLGVPVIVRAFVDPGLVPWAFALKLLFTAVTLSVGFLGGEVTPLFFVGACLGNALAGPLGLPLGLAAGVGMAAVFGAAANTPLALSIMAVELLGGAVLPHVVIVTVVAYLLTGQRGIYPAQRIARLKHGGPLLGRLVPLRDLRSEDEAPPGRRK
ncbi:chloride channel protein [Aggregicoccus sp. 17bor-14]|uniref:chloride channel protein n=1 Tax=Myxococcaceae TaxID=31 RepID=UPI00129C83BB|nr:MULTISPECIES: chloride channel protein [Myxococcaceae]MBF5046632.1 chloride channel protein [Simulacricoccus sp. 17bor-14]MRI92342.1 chloride channel protein [Aggregicoccus sp. 17bor-14]